MTIVSNLGRIHHYLFSFYIQCYMLNLLVLSEYFQVVGTPSLNSDFWMYMCLFCLYLNRFAITKHITMRAIKLYFPNSNIQFIQYEIWLHTTAVIGIWKITFINNDENLEKISLLNSLMNQLQATSPDWWIRCWSFLPMPTCPNP